MAAPLEVKLRNAESSLLFMQQEHAKTLQALHQELHKLQKKCAELTFELAMKSDGDGGDEDAYKSEIADLKEKLEQKEKECNSVQEERDHIQTRHSDYEQEMRMRERVYKDEMSQLGQKVVVLSAELDQRSGTIAYLTTQLHQLKLRQVRPTPPPMLEQDRTESDRVTSPAPPKDPAPMRVRRFNIRTGNGPVRAVHGKQPPEPSQAQSRMFSRFRHMTAPSSHSSNSGRRMGVESVPDVATFIAHVDTSGKEVEVKPAPPILPPITPQDVVRRDYSTLAAEVETLAIEKPYGAESSLMSPDHSPVHTD